MATQNSPERHPSAAKKRAPAGEWKSPDRPMIEAHVDVTPEPFIVQNDKVRVFKKQKGRRRAPKGLVCDFSFSCARVVSCTDHQQQPWEAGRWILMGARTGPGAQGPGRGSKGASPRPSRNAELSVI
jgi:hypothetical protein